MRAVIQRVSEASVTVDDQVVGSIELGFLVLLGVENGDTETDANYLADKTIGLRVFADADDKMNLDIAQVGGKVLAVSQFTLLGDCRKGRRPAFTDAADPEIARQLYEHYCQRIRTAGIEVRTGIFAADMQVHLVNQGPVTLLLDSRKRW
ncbi:D-tyrosyl-tRNA(Tyr) deacylase [Rosistilla carotiformis]|uniref:D-aminoacyl-tRNA deacylase n=1 Tax=Rosistilla carotiformis TaxID=2528017 RepID=A0A518JMG4_9BACT|nr:D-aminoacyl-tRNA deacylase [Rosistilla carotiformis]QDV66745.1 D-tyrosyl-tRNA(Tyr) deacylase [Rosistilla carotiformis]